MEQLNKEASITLARAVMTLFGYWNIPRSTQCSLLGISLTNTNRLRAMERGIRGIPMGRDSQERIRNLLAIHKNLRVLYPHNPEIRYGWVNMRNAKLHGRTPMDIMDAEGYIGIAKIKSFLNTNCQR